MGPVMQVLQEQGPTTRDDLVHQLASGRTAEDVDKEIAQGKSQGLIDVDAEGFWGLTAAGAARF
jgi:hypothetical protein